LRDRGPEDPVDKRWGYLDFSRVNEALTLKLKENDPGITHAVIDVLIEQIDLLIKIFYFWN